MRPSYPSVVNPVKYLIPSINVLLLILRILQKVLTNAKEGSKNVNLRQTYPLQGKGANCVFSQCLCLKQSDFDVTIHLTVIRPVFTALHLFKSSEATELNLLNVDIPGKYTCKTTEGVTWINLFRVMWRLNLLFHPSHTKLKILSFQSHFFKTQHTQISWY